MKPITERLAYYGGVGMGFFGLAIAWFICFLIISAIFMVLWNKAVMNAFFPGFVQEIDFVTSMGLVFFWMMISCGPVMVFVGSSTNQ